VSTTGKDPNRKAAPFADRRAAGRALAQTIAALREHRPTIMAIPRGGVPVAAEIARLLNAELDVVVARKLGSPAQPELAIGAVTADGGIYLDHELINALAVPPRYLAAVIARERKEAQRREARYRGAMPKRSLKGATVIVVDDGLATGATMRAAVCSLRASDPRWVIVAVPVASPEAVHALLMEANEVVALLTPEPFRAVGCYYERFGQTSDQTVITLLRAAQALTHKAA
jgi:putative phosphoribosyl transferase